MHHSTAAILEPCWLPIAELPASVPKHLCSWLRAEVSLTKRLQQLGHFQVKVIREEWARCHPSECELLGIAHDILVWQREVVLMVNSIPWIVARSCIPPSTLDNISPLKTLGERSLGDVIFSELNGTRESLEFTALLPTHELFNWAKHYSPPYSQQPNHQEEQWARRSVLVVEQHRLLVNEVFLQSMVIPFSDMSSIK